MSDSRPDWGPFALLVIDVQRDFWGAGEQKSFPRFPKNLTHLLAWSRGQELEVVHLRAIFQPDRSDWMIRYRLTGRIPCVAGSPGSDLLPFAAEQPGEAVFLKQSFDGFQNPSLLPYLRRRGKRFLLTAGLITSTCVFLTTASAAQNGFLTAVVEDCCADEPDAHNQTLDRYRFIFDRVTSTAIPARHAAWMEQIQKIGPPQK